MTMTLSRVRSAASSSSAARITCGATASSCRWRASRPLGCTSAARLWSRPTASPTRWASRSCGSRTMGFAIAQQLGWRTAQHVVVPMAGGALIGKIHKAFQELATVGLIEAPRCAFYGAQATGCNPISDAVKTGREVHKPVKRPNTIAKSLAIGDPADGYFAAKVIRDTGGWAEDVSDAEIAECMALLARTEGIFAETAGGVTLAVARKLIEQGRLPRDEEVVLCITGNGLKTQEAVAGVLEEPAAIGTSLDEFTAVYDG